PVQQGRLGRPEGARQPARRPRLARRVRVPARLAGRDVARPERAAPPRAPGRAGSGDDLSEISITDGGMETTLIFHEGLELPDFASFVLLDDPAGIGALRAYYRTYLEIARNRGVGIVLDTPTWRANRDWGERLGYSEEELAAETAGGAAYFMINCAHPTHFESVLEPAPWLDRLRGLRANASKKSHAELDEADELDEGDPAELAAAYAELRKRLPNLNVVG